MKKEPALVSVLGFSIFVGGAWFVAFLLAVFARILFDVRTPVTSLTAIFMLAFAPLLVARGDPGHKPRRLIALALGYFMVAPLLVMGGLQGASEALITSHWRCGTGDLVFVVLPFILAILGTLAAIFGALLSHATRLDRVWRALSYVAVGASVLLVGAGVWRSSRHADIDVYLESLPVVATIPPSIGDVTITLPPPAGTFLARRACEGEQCNFALGRDPLQMPARMTAYLGSETSAPIAVKVTPTGQIILEANGRRVAFAEVGGELTPTSVTTRDVAVAAAPPRGWLVGGFLGLVIAATLSMRRRRERALLTQLLAARTGHRTPTGWVEIDDGTSPFRDDKLPVGPVTILGLDINTAAYRGGAPAPAVLAGAREALVFAARERVSSFEAMTLGVLCLLVAPLVSAALLGLLF
jgi:hypothetical protein